jgi:uncharacterized RDD family membrane protein YckC
VILASRLSRLLAQGVDTAIGFAPIVLAFAFVPTSSGGTVAGAFVFFASWLWAGFYYLFADGLHGGQSIAKQWLGMRVVDAHTRSQCTFYQSFVRNLLLLLLGPIDWMFIVGEQHQRLGDAAAGTVVIDV